MLLQPPVRNASAVRPARSSPLCSNASSRRSYSADADFDMVAASQELGSLPGIDEEIAALLLGAGFRTVEEVSLASLEDLTGIEGIAEETAMFLGALS